MSGVSEVVRNDAVERKRQVVVDQLWVLTAVTSAAASTTGVSAGASTAGTTAAGTCTNKRKERGNLELE
jgi:hypothetical protein